MIQFKADRVSIRGPKNTDNSFVVSFDVGEYERQSIKDLFTIEPDKILKVSVETV